MDLLDARDGQEPTLGDLLLDGGGPPEVSLMHKDWTGRAGLRGVAYTFCPPPCLFLICLPSLYLRQ